MAESFLDLSPTSQPGAWRLRAEPRLCVGWRDNAYLYGGVGLAAAVSALERSVGRPILWASAQFLGPIRPDSEVTIEVTTAVAGHQIAQAKASLSVAGQERISVSAALGARPDDLSVQWRMAPRAPQPEDIPADQPWICGEGPLFDALETRKVHEATNAEDGCAAFWVRPRAACAVDATLLAVLADMAPQGVDSALGRTLHTTSLDNTLRIHRIEPTDWVLLELRTSGLGRGVAHVEVGLFARNGVLMATASQSIIARHRAAA